MYQQNTRRGQTQNLVVKRLSLLLANGGFTLLEILVVVLIIGILGAIALPQYQRAVLKSRYAALMPIAKSMADSNEAYYLEYGEYAEDAEDLPIQGRMNYPDGTTLEFGTTTAHAYVLATRDNNFPNNYIVYQKHSTNYPGEIHCEADSNNTQAQEVCKSFGATEDIGETLTPNYLTYVLSGTGNGIAPSIEEALDEVEEETTPYDCTKAEQKGYTCFSDEEKGVRSVCIGEADWTYCRTKHYNDEDGSYSSITCAQSDWDAATGLCKKGRITIYDDEGRKISYAYCDSVDTNGSCKSFNTASGEYDGKYRGTDYIYEEDGYVKDLICRLRRSDGSCQQYTEQTQDALGKRYYAYKYDEYGNKIERISCRFSGDTSCNSVVETFYYDNTYDGGNLKEQKMCSQKAEDGSYSSCSQAYYYDYDSQNRKTKEIYCAALATDGSCNYSVVYDYTYEGAIQIRKQCSTVESDGSCSAYGTRRYTVMDADGKDLYDYYCYASNIDPNTGECTQYSMGDSLGQSY